MILKDFRQNVFRVDDTSLKPTNWELQNPQLHKVHDNIYIVDGLNIYDVNKDLRLIKSFNSPIQSIGIIKGDLAVLTNQGLNIRMDSEWVECPHGIQDTISKKGHLLYFGEKNLLINENQILELCEDHMVPLNLNYKIFDVLPLGSALLLISEEGLKTYQEGRIRKYFIPGVTFPKDIKEVKHVDNNLWMKTDDKELYAFDIDRQLVLNKASNVAHFDLDSWNTLYTIADNKYYKFVDPENTSLPIINFKKLEVNYKEVEQLSVLNSNENNIGIELEAFYSPGEDAIQYVYSLNEGQNWIDLNNSQKIVLTDLKSGSYQLLVKATVDDQYYSRPISLDFEIKPDFLSSFWPYIFGGLVLLLMIAFWSQKRVQRQNDFLEREKEKLKLQLELNEQKQKLGQLRLNPHFLFNSLNSISGLIALKDNKAARTHLNQFSQLMRSMLDNSFEDRITVGEELKFLEKYLSLERMIRDSKFDFEISSLDQSEIEIPIMIIQPFVENAILHGIKHKQGKGNILINLETIDTYLKVSIIDDGVGRKEAARFAKEGHSSKAISITADRLKGLDKFGRTTHIEYIDLEENETPKGTQVNLFIPIIKRA